MRLPAAADMVRYDGVRERGGRWRTRGAGLGYELRDPPDGEGSGGPVCCRRDAGAVDGPASPSQRASELGLLIIVGDAYVVAGRPALAGRTCARLDTSRRAGMGQHLDHRGGVLLRGEPQSPGLLLSLDLPLLLLLLHKEGVGRPDRLRRGRLRCAPGRATAFERDSRLVDRWHGHAPCRGDPDSDDARASRAADRSALRRRPHRSPDQALQPARLSRTARSRARARAPRRQRR